MYINAFPSLSPFTMVKKKNYILPPLMSNKTIFCYYGRNAIYHAMKVIKISPDENVLMPAYHCGVEVEAILSSRAKVKFYEIKPSTEVDINRITREIDENTKAIFIIHYFGFPQPLDKIKDICSQNNIYLIEDCAHSLFSSYNGNFLGSFGDMSIFSLTKSLPIPNGGALLINNPNLDYSDNSIPPGQIMTLRGLALLLIAYFRKNSIFFNIVDFIVIKPLKFGFRLIKKLQHQITSKDLIPDATEFNVELTNLGISQMSKRLMNNFDFKDIIIKRRQNFLFLLNEFKNHPLLRPVFHDLPDEVCPLFFPVIIDNRDMVYSKLLESGIATFIFGRRLHPSLMKEKFLNSNYLAQHNLCLPIHSDISKKQLNYMVKVINEIIPNYALDTNEHELTRIKSKR